MFELEPLYAVGYVPTDCVLRESHEPGLACPVCGTVRGPIALDEPTDDPDAAAPGFLFGFLISILVAVAILVAVHGCPE